MGPHDSFTVGSVCYGPLILVYNHIIMCALDEQWYSNTDVINGLLAGSLSPPPPPLHLIFHPIISLSLSSFPFLSHSLSLLPLFPQCARKKLVVNREELVRREGGGMEEGHPTPPTHTHTHAPTVAIASHIKVPAETSHHYTARVNWFERDSVFPLLFVARATVTINCWLYNAHLFFASCTLTRVVPLSAPH